MGIIRLILAFSVAIMHAGGFYGWALVDAFHAVTIFFVISGFYMTMILNEKYPHYWDFIINRLLKIFPAYLVTVMIAQLFDPIAFGTLPFGVAIYFIWSNFAILFSHFTAIIVQSPDQAFGLLPFGRNVTVQEMTWKYLYNGPVWSLSVELIFYFLAPFIVRIDRRYVARVAAFMLLSFAVDLYLHINLASGVPWTYNMVLPNMFYFMLGSLSYYLFKGEAFQALIRYSPLVAACMLLLLVGMASVYSLVPDQFPLLVVDGWTSRRAVAVLLVFLFMPYIFALTQRSRLDRYLGELSYPVYVSHYVILYHLPAVPGIHPLATTVIASIGLQHLVINPIETHVRARISARTASLAKKRHLVAA